MIYKLTLGDWSKDGHGQYREFLFDCNYDVHKIRQAYKDSCKKLGISFNHNSDYTELGLRFRDERQIWTEYEDENISEFAFNVLKTEGCLDNIDYHEEDGEYFIEGYSECATLIMNFIALSMPNDFEYKLVEKEDYEPINGWWNDELNEQFGYGMFY